MQLGDYADGGWFFIVECKSCGRQSRLEPNDILDRYTVAERGMLLKDLESHLLCRDCRCRRARLEAVARIPKQAFVAGML